MKHPSGGTSSALQTLLVVALMTCRCVTAFSTPSTCQSTRLSLNQLHHRQLLKWQSSPSTALCSKYQTETRFSASSSSSRTSTHRYVLFQTNQQQEDEKSQQLSPLKRVLKQFQLRVMWASLLKVHRHLKRAMMIVMASAMIWFGTAGSYTPPAQASTAPSNVIERVMPSRTTQQIIDRYVQQHMFDDDDAMASEPLESAYREAYEDYVTKGSHPRALKEISSEIMGSRKVKGLTQADDSEGSRVFSLLTGVMKFLEQKVGLSETTAMVVIGASLVIAAPSSLLYFGMIVGGISKRNMNKLMKKRYGETYTLDATIKEEPDVEAPDDEDDDDDAEDDDDENDDDDDED